MAVGQRVGMIDEVGSIEVRGGAEEAEPPLNCGETRSSAWISEYPDRVMAKPFPERDSRQ